MPTPTPAEQAKQAKEVVERSRRGDQNATALIASTRNAADRGNPVAHSAMGHIKDYITRHPFTFHGDSVDTVNPKKNKVVYTAGGLVMGALALAPLGFMGIGALGGAALGWLVSK